VLIHPDCQSLVTALANYRRKKRAGQWCDEPEDPQHPHEDLVDALRGGLKHALPEGVKVETTKHRVREVPVSGTLRALLGEHTDEVLAQLGYNAEQIKAMHAEGAV
jgi:crotonobetainyl-CoA:carnitine CoA-transferase CaiB-like acyl-CoA transferase